MEEYNFRDQVIALIERSKDAAAIPFDSSKKEYLVTRRHTRLSLQGACADLFHHFKRFFSSI